MATHIEHKWQGRIDVVTEDLYGNTRRYRFKRRNGGVAEPQDGYTLTVLEALWDEGVPVEWSHDDLSPQDREQVVGS